MKVAIRRSPVGRLLAEAGATVTVEAGWELASSFGDAAKERWFLRDRCGLADITARAKVDVRGNVDPALATRGDGRVARLSSTWALVLGPPGTEIELLGSLASGAGSDAMVTDATHLFVGLAVGGPGLDGVLARTSSWDPATLAPGGAAGAPVAGVRAVMLRPELSIPMVEIYLAPEYGRYAWETMAAVVRSQGGGPVGWDALRAEGWS